MFFSAFDSSSNIHILFCHPHNNPFHVLPTPLGTTESQGIELSGRIQILDSGDLLISNVRESDAGLYTCIRANEAGIVTEEAYLGVMGKFGFV